MRGDAPPGSGRPPDHRPGGIVYRLPVPGNPFAVAFHICLFQVHRQAAQVVIVRQDRSGLGTEEIVVPDTQQGQKEGDAQQEGSGDGDGGLATDTAGITITNASSATTTVTGLAAGSTGHVSA